MNSVIEINREAYARYVYRVYIILFTLLVPVFGIGIILLLIWTLGWGKKCCAKWANDFTAVLGETSLRVTSGGIFKSVKSVPLDQIASVTHTQGPLEKKFGIWRLCVNTASPYVQTTASVYPWFENLTITYFFFFRFFSES